jgi:hypothetical protein
MIVAVVRRKSMMHVIAGAEMMPNNNLVSYHVW